MKLRICISGPSGTGKSTLAKHISQKYNIPFITSSTKPLWDKHGINSHQELIKKGTLDPKWGLEFQYEVLKFREEAIKDQDQFVTDRSPFDNLVYFFLQNVHLCTEKETEDYMQRCNSAMENHFTGIICLPFTPLIKLEDDGKRVNNKYYQVLTNNTFSMAGIYMKKSLNKIKGDTLQMWDFEERCQRVAELIKLIESTHE